MNITINSKHYPISITDGAGVKINRLFPVPELDYIDPFLLFDHFGSENPKDYISGFPMHPHRGIETVTYMLEGVVKHHDSNGHQGVIKKGGVQWMSAGQGIMHEEMPQISDGKLSGLQLWINLPAKLKMKSPEYQEFSAEEVTSYKIKNHHVNLISGNLNGKQGRVTSISMSPVYADIQMESGELSLDMNEEYNSFIYLLEGSLEVLSDNANSIDNIGPMLLTLTKGRKLVLRSKKGARFILASAQPISEPVARWGPFVMNTQEEIQQTLQEIIEGNFPPVIQAQE
ncbi:pirin family protein [Kangiella sp. HZ709]|uniref:pirin family protein n=1 Tax=Kangiella sp. HZ709 TaxID=2666328 RepID=UPI0012B0A897|nr:pirin family protein [Kangiella sp. HZ709]MRX26882.1 hypothetical protein [Kangiella sp. HZ709]